MSLGDSEIEDSTECLNGHRGIRESSALSVMPQQRGGGRKRPSQNHEESRSKRAKATSNRKRNVDINDAFDNKRCSKWFNEYCGPGQERIEPEGMIKLCEDIGVAPENIVMLSLAWKLGAEHQGYFTRDEWTTGMTDLQCDCIGKLQNKLVYLKSLLNDCTAFKSIYRYAFDFSKEKSQRSMDIETAKGMMSLLLENRWPLFPCFHQFLEQSKYKVINKDQWCNVLEFSRLIKPDLSNYDEDGAWPVMLDEFVEWYREQNPNVGAAACSYSEFAMC